MPGARGGVQRDINVTPLIDVLLVLLIIFLVVMPMMMKLETLVVPRELDPDHVVEPDTTFLTVKVKADLGVVLDENGRETAIEATDLARTLRPKLEALHTGTDKVVFVDFDDTVPWSQLVSTMDTIRSLASDVDHDAIKIALKIKPGPRN